MKKKIKKRRALASLFRGLAENVADAFDAAASSRTEQVREDQTMAGVKAPLNGCGGCK